MQTYEIIFRTIPIGIALVRSDLSVVRANRALLSLLGFKNTEELSIAGIKESIHPWDLEKFESLIGSTHKKLRRNSAQMRVFSQENTLVWVEMTAVWTQDNESSTSFVLMVQDIDERMQVERELIEVRRKLIESLEAERLRMSQDLHNGPMQDLHSISYRIASYLEKCDDDIRQLLNEVTESIQNVNSDLRGLAYELRPPALANFGLSKSIEAHAYEFLAKHPELKIHLELTPDGGLLSEELTLALFRIYQQALMNTLKHAEADSVTVGLALDGDAVELTIQDDGKGFTVPNNWVSLVRAGHYGLAGTADRVKALGGEFKIDSAPGEGTTITVIFKDYLED